MRRSIHVHWLNLIFSLLLGSCVTAVALDSPRELSQFGHEVWLTENGLPQNTVHAIAQTSDGYIWIGTEEGLARFDGVKFTVFDKQNTPEIKSNYIRSLLADRQGALWIGTAQGLYLNVGEWITVPGVRHGTTRRFAVHRPPATGAV